MKYIVYRETGAKKPEQGDWVTVAMVYKDEKDSVLFDSRKNGKPLRFALRKPPFAGSFEEGLTYLSPGDSATFFVSADSMFKHVISQSADSAHLRRPRAGSFLKFDVSLLNIQPYKEAEMEIAMNESRMENAETNALEKYLKEKNNAAEKQPDGYYMLIQSHGKGAQIKTGSVVQVNYTATFLNGAVFNSNKRTGKPYSFEVGSNDVIAGWNLAFQKLHYGDKATLIIPSRLAYGGKGIPKPNNNGYVVPPFSTLIFEVEVLFPQEVTRK